MSKCHNIKKQISCTPLVLYYVLHSVLYLYTIIVLHIVNYVLYCVLYYVIVLYCDHLHIYTLKYIDIKILKLLKLQLPP